jgi:hypothetical protein
MVLKGFMRQKKSIVELRLEEKGEIGRWAMGRTVGKGGVGIGWQS